MRDFVVSYDERQLLVDHRNGDYSLLTTSIY
jgi:hypothetical protein